MSRLRLDARLYENPPEPEAGKKGRKPKKGKPIASFKTMRDDETLDWTTVEVNGYGGKKKTLRYITGVNLMDKPK